MRIAIADSCALKFSKDIKEHWELKGHEVRYEIGASEILSQWCDLYYIDWSDNNIHYLFNIYKGRHPEHPNGASYKRPKFIVRAIDIDIWQGKARSQELVDFVDQWICIAPHMEKKLRAEATYREGQLVCIRPGVNLDRFTLKVKKTDGFQLGMVASDLWWYKNHMGALDIFASLYKRDRRWKFHIRGKHEPGEFNPVMYQHYLESRGISDAVTLYPMVDDMNMWLENIDVLLHTGMKETFCYAVGEAMAKGIPALVNEFYGSRDIWDARLLYQTHEEAVAQLAHKVEITEEIRKGARAYIEEKHNIKTMLAAFDEVLQT